MSIGPQLRMNVGDDGIKVSTDAVHLVHKDEARHTILGRLAPHRFGLRLDTSHATEHDDGTVQHPQRALHLGGEVHVTGSVDDIDAVALTGG